MECLIALSGSYWHGRIQGRNSEWCLFTFPLHLLHKVHYIFSMGVIRARNKFTVNNFNEISSRFMNQSLDVVFTSILQLFSILMLCISSVGLAYRNREKSL